jgi:hypothetical protein
MFSIRIREKTDAYAEYTHQFLTLMLSMRTSVGDFGVKVKKIFFLI